MDTSMSNPDTTLQVGLFERYVQELCRKYVEAQLHEMSQNVSPSQTGKGEKFLTKREAANLIGKGEKMIDNYRKKGMPVHMFGRTPMFLESEIIAFMDTYKKDGIKE